MAGARPSRARVVSLVTTAALAVVALGASGCDKESAQAGPGKGPAPDDDALIAAWKQANLEVSPFTEADAAPYAAKACRAGTVGGVDVVLCSYDSDQTAAAAQDPALALLEKGGALTASALVRGKTLLVVNDKRKADPTGRSIDAITSAFRK